MSLLLYMDVHVPRAITRTLTAAGVDVISTLHSCSQLASRVCLVALGHANFACGMCFKLR